MFDIYGFKHGPFGTSNTIMFDFFVSEGQRESDWGKGGCIRDVREHILATRPAPAFFVWSFLRNPLVAIHMRLFWQARASTINIHAHRSLRRLSSLLTSLVSVDSIPAHLDQVSLFVGNRIRCVCLRHFAS
jgi:hypothetical protein